MLYQVCGMLIESNLPLFEQAYSGRDTAECRFRLAAAAPADHQPQQWFHEWREEDGVSWLLFGHRPGGYLLRFPDLADFSVSSDGGAIECVPLPGVPLETIRHLLLDQVVPLVCSRRGRLALHASAVATPAGALAFVGTTGQGKSTLAASLVLRGFPLLTDDCLVLDLRAGQLYGTPSYPGVRLWDDSLATLFAGKLDAKHVAHYTTKRRVAVGADPASFHNAPIPILRIYFLATPEGGADENAVRVTLIPPSLALVDLVRFSFKLDITDQALLREEFQLLSKIVTMPLLYRLTFPHDYAWLTQAQSAVLAPLGDLA